MEFGKLNDITNVRWDLPLDDPANKERLQGLKDKHDFKLYFGSPAWGIKQWCGKLYPQKTPSEEYLSHYSQHFTCIELNTTHYRIPDTKTVNGWRSKVPTHFQFCPKVFKEISHGRMGLLDKNLLTFWTQFLSEMEGNLGPCFIQLHEMFSYQDKKLLFHFLEGWPREFKLTLELRHASWFENGRVLPALVDYLHRKNIGLVVTDVAGRRDILHSSLSSSWTQIRLIGNNLDPSDERRLQDWAQRILEWKKLGLQDVYLFLHQPEDLFTIEFARMASDIFKNNGFENVPAFQMEHVQQDLFDSQTD